MFNLILKDFRIQKKFYLLAIGYGFFIIFIFDNHLHGEFKYVMGALGITYMFSFTAITYDNLAKAEVIFNSLPIEKTKIVLARYLSTGLIMLISLMVMAAIGIFFKLLGLNFVQSFINIKDLFITFISVGLLISISFPLNYKINSKYLRIVNLILFMVAFFLPSTVAEILQATNTMHIFQEMVWYILAAVLGVLIISFGISLKIYKNKEF